jgi:hypothetical protein
VIRFVCLPRQFLESSGKIECLNENPTLLLWRDAATDLLVRDWHRSAACVNGSDAVASGCVSAVSAASSEVVTMRAGMEWPHTVPPESPCHPISSTACGYGAEWHTTQLYTVTQVAQPGEWVLLGETHATSMSTHLRKSISYCLNRVA